MMAAKAFRSGYSSVDRGDHADALDRTVLTSNPRYAVELLCDLSSGGHGAAPAPWPYVQYTGTRLLPPSFSLRSQPDT